MEVLSKLIRFFHDNNTLVMLFVIGILFRIVIAFTEIFMLPESSITDGSINNVVFQLLEPYQDYRGNYLRFVSTFVSTGSNPYTNSMYYIYPPLFLYILSFFAIINLNLCFIPLLAADLLLPFVIYQLLSHLRHDIAQWGFLASILCPLNAYYNGGLFLNTALLSLAFTVTIYFLFKEQFKRAMLTLALTVLIKQMIILTIPLILTYAVLQTVKDERKISNYVKFFAGYGGIVAATLLVGSLPWILLDPIAYLFALSSLPTPTLTPIFAVPQQSWPLNWYSIFIVLGFPEFLLYIFGFLNFTALGLILIQIVTISLLIRWHRNNTLDWLKILDLLVYSVIFDHLFFPRGIYKYYLTVITPLIIIWLCFHFYLQILGSPTKSTNLLLKFLFMSFILLIIPRLVYLLLLWAIVLVMLRWSWKHSKNVGEIQQKELIFNEKIMNL